MRLPGNHADRVELGPQEVAAERDDGEDAASPPGRRARE